MENSLKYMCSEIKQKNYQLFKLSWRSLLELEPYKSCQIKVLPSSLHTDKIEWYEFSIIFSMVKTLFSWFSIQNNCSHYTILQ